jgi:hypothetical protein
VLAAVAAAGLLLFCFAMPETKISAPAEDRDMTSAAGAAYMPRESIP